MSPAFPCPSFPSTLALAASLVLSAAFRPASGQGVAVHLAGIVTDSAGAPIAGASLALEASGLTAVSGQDGRFTLGGAIGVRPPDPDAAASAGLRDGTLHLTLPARSVATVTAAAPDGREVATLRRRAGPGTSSLPLPGLGTGVRFLRIEAGAFRAVIKAQAVDGVLRAAPDAADVPDPGAADVAGAALAKPAAAAALYDVLTATKTGFQKAYASISKADSSGITIKMLKDGSPRFSFFVTSMRALQALAKSDSGFGGDLRYGETGPGAGLRGADKLCAAIAERSMAGASVKGWRAFLSVSQDAHGRQVNAIDRVGPGPWYDRTGRVLALTKADLLNVRPANADPAIALDLPNEFGIPNKRPDPNGPEEDNHHMITGSHTDGRLRSASATCKDWTSADGPTGGRPGAGLAWPRGGTLNPGGAGSHWMAMLDLPGCAPSVEVLEAGGPRPGANTIGSGGGYGGFYCFALNP